MPRPERVTVLKTTDKEFIEHPAGWPRWPFLPMKRRNDSAGFPDVGLLVAREGQLSTILLDLTIWDGNLPEKLASWTDKKGYASVEEMLADGWVVD